VDYKNWVEMYRRLVGRIERDTHMMSHWYKSGEKIATMMPNGKIVFFGEYVGSDMTKDDLNIYASIKEKSFNEKSFNEAQAKATEARNKFWDEFKRELLQWHGIQNHPKADKFWDILRNNNGDDIQALIGDAEKWAESLKSMKV